MPRHIRDASRLAERVSRFVLPRRDVETLLFSSLPKSKMVRQVKSIDLPDLQSPLYPPFSLGADYWNTAHRQASIGKCDMSKELAGTSKRAQSTD